MYNCNCEILSSRLYHPLMQFCHWKHHIKWQWQNGSIAWINVFVTLILITTGLLSLPRHTCCLYPAALSWSLRTPILCCPTNCSSLLSSFLGTFVHPIPSCEHYSNSSSLSLHIFSIQWRYVILCIQKNKLCGKEPDSVVHEGGKIIVSIMEF